MVRKTFVGLCLIVYSSLALSALEHSLTDNKQTPPIVYERKAEQALAKDETASAAATQRTVREQESERRKEDNDAALTFWTKALADWTFVLVLVAAVQAYLFIRQLGVTQEALRDSRDAANAARDSADAARASAEALPKIERAYLFVEVKLDPNYQPIAGNAYKATIQVVITNHGKTPAILTRLRAYANTQELAPTELIDHGRANITLPKGIVVGAGLPWVYSIPSTVTREHYAILNDVVQRIYCIGAVDYDDVLGSRRSTGFCWQSFPENDVIKFTIAPVDALNYFS